MTSFSKIGEVAGALIGRQEAEPKKVGTVKWYHMAKGYGFIRPDEEGVDIFITQAELDKAGIATLQKGIRLEYKVKTERKTGRRRAYNVAILEEEE